MLVKGLDLNFFNFDVKYAKNRLLTGHNADFMTEERFVKATAKGAKTLSIEENRRNFDPHNWNTYICCWAASHARNLAGDFVECGVNTGILSIAVMEYIDFNSTGKTFYLCDTYEGIPEKQVSREEQEFYASINANVVTYHNTAHYIRNIYETVKKQFAPYKAKVIKGKVPDTLDQIETNQVSYLSLDMNITPPTGQGLIFKP